MADLVGGASVGLVFTELWYAVKGAKRRVKDFKPQLRELQWTLKVLDPVIEDIRRINTQLDEPNQSEVVERLTSIMTEGNKLVCKCLKVSRWNFIKKSYYQKKLVELDNKIIRFNIKYILLCTNREVKSLRLEQRSGFEIISNQIESLMVENSAAILIRPQLPPSRSATIPRFVIFGLIWEFICDIIYRSKTLTVSMLESSEIIWMGIKDMGTLKTTIKQLDDTMKSLVHVLEEIESNKSEASRSLRSLLKVGENLVSESSKIGWWNFVKKWQYQKKMVELDNKLLRICSLHLQARLTKNSDKT